MKRLRRLAQASAAIVAAYALTGLATAQIPSAADLAVPAGTPTAQRALNGPIDVVVRLADAPLADLHGRDAKRRGSGLSREQAQAHKDLLRARQDSVMQSVRAHGGTELARTQNALNSVIVRIDRSQLAALSRIAGVVGVRPVRNYTRDLAETVPYIGAAATQAAGKDGSGATVAVLDSGVDYTHRNLGGSGSLADYQAAFAARETAFAGFPTAKVVGGFDFVGETWPNGPRTEDPNPIDQEGHGTHVADIIAGRSNDGAHKGVAPGAKLLAIKVCSAVATSCNGIALLRAMDFALDPNGDGDISDAADVINMSLGSSYGQAEDDLSEASANAVRLGVVVVASAGNSGDRPYITGSPASTPEVISVAQTQVPGATAVQLRINSPAGIAGLYPNTATVDWAPIGAGFTGDVAFVGRGCNVDAYLANPAGRVALIDRGACNISEKVLRASNAGAIGVLIGLVAAGDAVTFSNGGECPAVPNGTCKASLVITQADSNRIKANLATALVNVTVSNANALPLVGSVVGSSSRGPNVSYSQIKPDIGAPGASVSAIAGSGVGTEPFGGTSGAAPMVAGSAAILLGANPSLSPAEVRARLMNTADSNILTNPATLPGVLAPITRIGAGEVRVNRALGAGLMAWDRDTNAGSLSFGFLTAHADRTLTRQVEVRNLTSTDRVLAITPSFRYANDAASGAVTIRTPNSIRVRAGATAHFNVQLRINAATLPGWLLNGGSQGGNGPLLQSVEFDGYVTLADAAGSIALPWHVLPRKSANVEAAVDDVAAGGSVLLTNTGAVDGPVEVFALTGKGRRVPKKELPQPGDNFALIDLRAVGARLVSIGGGQFGAQFAVTTFGERAHPNYPAEFDVYIDSNNDGVDDFAVFNSENGGFGATGQNVVSVFNLATNSVVGTFFFTDANLNSANAILTVPLAAVGLTPASTFRFSVYGFDNYFTGNLTDAIENMVFNLGTPRYAGSGIPATGVAAGGSATLTVQSVPGGDTASPSQSGLLLMYRNARTRKEAELIEVRP